MRLETAYSNLALQLNGLIDRGETLTYQEVVSGVIGGTGLDWLEQRFPFPDLDLSLHQADITATSTVNDWLANCASGGDLSNYALQGREGLCALVAWCIDGFQVTATRWED